MKSCENCIHNVTCHHSVMCEVMEEEGYEYELPKDCKSFKDKSLCIELPCNIGDTIYLTPRYNGKPTGAIVADKVQMIGITSRGVHIKARDHQNFNKMYILGHGAYLSSEAAQEALKKESEAK